MVQNVVTERTEGEMTLKCDPKIAELNHDSDLFFPTMSIFFLFIVFCFFPRSLDVIERFLWKRSIFVCIVLLLCISMVAYYSCVTGILNYSKYKVVLVLQPFTAMGGRKWLNVSAITPSNSLIVLSSLSASPYACLFWYYLRLWLKVWKLQDSFLIASC